MSSAEMNAGIDAAVAEAKVAAGLDPAKKYPPMEWVGHLDEQLSRAFWRRQTRRILDEMIADASSDDGPTS